jgi:hypothetical protein
MAIQLLDIADLVLSQIAEFEEKGVIDLFQTLREYKAEECIGMMKSEGAESHSYKWNLTTASNNPAQMVGVGQTLNPTIASLQQQATISFRQANTNWSYDDQEVSANEGGKRRIVDMIKTRQMDAMRSLADVVENQFWGRPVSSTDNLSMHGIKYWLVQNATLGFNGQLPGGSFTDVAGVSPSTTVNWRNYTGAFSAIDIPNFIDKLDDATWNTTFKSPVSMNQLGTGSKMPKHAYFTTWDNHKQIVRLMETRRDNIGPESAPDLGLYWGKAHYRGNPIHAVAWLQANTTNNPFYGISFDDWVYKYHNGWKQKTYRPMKDKTQPTMNTVHVYTEGNFVCLNRRKNFVLYNSTSGSADT